MSKASSLIPLAPLRDHTAAKFQEWVKKTPNEEHALRLLEAKALEILAGNSAAFDDLEKRLEQIVDAADALDNGYAFAASQKLLSELQGLARAGLSLGVPVYPELAVQLQLAQSSSAPGREHSAQPGSRTKLGGPPDWIQTDETPICPQCQKTMTFVAQIDSVAQEQTELGQRLTEQNSFMFADVGMIYVFWCSACFETRSVLQSG